MSNGRMLISLAALLVAGSSGPAAAADINQHKAAAAWKQSDNCAQEAFRKYPDYTPQSNARREAARQACQRNHRLPVTGGNAADAPSGSGDQ